MNKLQVVTWTKKTVLSAAAFAVMMVVSFSGNCFAQEFVGIQIFPEHVGIFTSVGKQQFIAFGIEANGNRTNITRNVNWISSNENRLTIDEKGLATIATGVTSGQVKVTCSYPKTGGNASSTSTNLLLLSK